jgi:hypothetical protein
MHLKWKLWEHGAMKRAWRMDTAKRPRVDQSVCVIVRGSEDVQMQQSGICSLLGLRLAGLLVVLVLFKLLMELGIGRGGAGPTMAARFLRFFSAAVLFVIIIVSHYIQQETRIEHT